MIAQIMIALFGVTAVFLSQSKSPVFRKYASVFGLLGQPFWMYVTYESQQWGMFALTFLYTWAWGNGFLNSWVFTRPRRWQK